MSLNLSNAQISKELGLTENDCHAMTSLLREDVYEKRPQELLEGEVFFEVYVLEEGRHERVVEEAGIKGCD